MKKYLVLLPFLFLLGPLPAFAAVTAHSFSPTSGTDGAFSVSYTVNDSKNYNVFFYRPNGDRIVGPEAGTCVQVGVGTKSCSVNLLTSDPFAALGDYSVVVLGRISSWNSARCYTDGAITEAQCLSDYAATEYLALTYTLTGAAPPPPPAGPSVPGLIGTSSAQGASVVLGGFVSSGITSIILLTMLAVSLPLAFFGIEQLIEFYNFRRLKNKK